ncbi:phosphoadenosine phosphosulfate reductase family protein [Oscillospiraceae bacterium OttesenSCG-928-F05]|nr:phosphoadenosine phosphosulfate reductase family protein [Oscillospiraceae bacterium OttesenSCG-928-F05]
MYDKKLVEGAIKRLRAFEPPEGYYLAFSGGKDSLVAFELARMAGVKFDAHTSITGRTHDESVDPPELIEFIDRFYAESELVFSNTTMWELIVKKLMPPTRMVRYCCNPLKQRNDKRRTAITGVRWAESAKRKKLRAMLEINLLSKHMQKANDILSGLEILANSKMRTRHVLNPIVDWTDNDVWSFIHHFSYPYLRLYDEGFKRLGCIGCPMGGCRNMQREFARYPLHYKKYLEAFEKMIDARKERGYGLNFFENPMAVMHWYMYGNQVKKQLPGQLEL